MAQTITKQVADLAAATVPLGTMQYLMVLDPTQAIAESVAWTAFNADNAAWRILNQGIPDPTLVPFAFAVDADNPTITEQLFIQSRFMVSYSDNPDRLLREPAPWAQLNLTNFPGMDISAYVQAAGIVYDAQRASAGLDPAV